MYDGIGVAIIGYAFFSKSVETITEESSTYWNANSSLLRSIVQARTDGVTGTILLFTGFVLQWLGSMGIQCEFASQILLGVLAVAILVYFIGLRTYFIGKQVAKAQDILKTRK